MNDDGSAEHQELSHETLIGIALAHAVVLLQVDVLTRSFSFRQVEHPGVGLAFFGLLVAALLVLPGAFIGWHVRGKSLSLRSWLSVAGPYWLLVALLSCFICVIPNAANPVSLLYGVLAAMFLPAGNRESPAKRRTLRIDAARVSNNTVAQEVPTRSAP